MKIKMLNNWPKLILGLCMLSACTSTPTTTNEAPSTDPQTTITPLEELTLSPSTPSSAETPQVPAQVFPLPQYSINTIWYWEVTSETAPTSYLVGTLHGNFGKEFSLPTSFVRGLNSIDTLYLESDTSAIEAEPEQVIQRILDPNAFLQQNMSTEELRQISERLKDSVMPPEITRPWFVNVSLSSPPNDVVTDRNGIMDLAIEKLAKSVQKKIAYLETAFELFDGVAAVPETEHLRLIREALKRTEAETIKETVETFTIYNTLDQNALLAAGQKIEAESAALSQATQSDRNLKWGKTLLPVMQTTPIMVAVGALHMVGETGLVAQLESQGFKVSFMGAVK